MTGYIDEQVKTLIINRLTREEYQELVDRGEVKTNELYVFPDIIPADVQTVEQLVQYVDNIYGEVTHLHETVYGTGSAGKDGLVDIINNIQQEIIVLQPLVDNIENILNLETRVEELEDKAIVAEESSELDTGFLVIYGGTSVDVMDDTV